MIVFGTSAAERLKTTFLFLIGGVAAAGGVVVVIIRVAFLSPFRRRPRLSDHEYV